MFQDRQTDGQETVLGVRPAQIAVPLAVAATAMVVATLVGRAMRDVWEVGGHKLLLRPFNVDAEGNVWTWFSSSLHLVNAMLCAAIATSRHRRRAPDWRHFAGLAAAFVVVSADETAAMHEVASEHVREAVGASGLLYNAWVIPAFVIVAALAAIYWPFLRRLPSDIFRLLVAAAGLFVGGAIGVELLTGAHKEVHGFDNFTMATLTAIEESLEAAGLIVCLYALLRLTGRERVLPA